MKGTIVVFRLPKKSEQRRLNQFCKRFYGQETSSHGGTYRYRRKGLLDSIPHRKLTRGVVIVLEKDVEIVLKFLKDFKAEVHIREVVLTPGDKRVLRKKS